MFMGEVQSDILRFGMTMAHLMTACLVVWLML